MQVKITSIFDYLSWLISAFPHPYTFDDNLDHLMNSHHALLTSLDTSPVLSIISAYELDTDFPISSQGQRSSLNQ